MRKLVLLSSATMLSLAPVVFGQTPGPAPRPATGAQAQAQAAARTNSGAEVMLIGCVMRETDYRKINDGGRGGVLGSGVGAGNEFVLVDASTLTSEEAQRRNAARTAKEKMPSAVGTSGTTGKAYSLSGEAEKNLVTDIGRLVEVVGTVDNSDATMPRVTISVWHPVGDFCPAK
jgi:hypothetical protein